MINHKIAKACDISIYCEITFKMWTADSEKTPFYNCAENVEVKMTDVNFILSIFVTEEVENELILKCLWEQMVKGNTSSWVDKSVEWTIHSFKKKSCF